MDIERARRHAEGIRSALVARRRAQADELVHITELALIYSIDLDDTCQFLVDRRSSCGGEGTPRVSEFFTLELAPLLQCSVLAAAGRTSDALDLRFRHPGLWEAVQALEVETSRALKAAGMCSGLPKDVADGVGRLWAARQAGLGWRAAFNLLEELIVQACPERAGDAEASAAADAGVVIGHQPRGRSTVVANLDTIDAVLLDGTLDEIASALRSHGLAGSRQQLRARALGVLAVPALALRLQQLALQSAIQPVAHGAGRSAPAPGPVAGSSGVVAAAEVTGSGVDPVVFDWLADQLRDIAPVIPGVDGIAQRDAWNPTPITTPYGHGPARAEGGGCLGLRCGTIEAPIGKLLPSVEVVIHIDADDIAAHLEGEVQGSAWIEHIGSVTLDTLVGMLDGKRIHARPVIDLNDVAAEDQYRPSRRLAQAVRLIHPYEAFPYSTRCSRIADLDHTDAWHAGDGPGQTRLGNLGPFLRRIHRAKTLGAWHCRQPRTGHFEWTSPLGYRYALTPNGTRPASRTWPSMG